MVLDTGVGGKILTSAGDNGIRRWDGERLEDLRLRPLRGDGGGRCADRGRLIRDEGSVIRPGTRWLGNPATEGVTT